MLTDSEVRETKVSFLPTAARVAPVPGPHQPSEAVLALKAVVDAILAVLLLVPAAPLMLLSVLLVRLTSRGPAIYSQTRLGLGGRPYRIYKVRTMYHDCEKTSGARWSTAGDARITPVGRFLRKTHLDELPQLWNVLQGDMSLVGPRPERPEFVPHLEAAIPHYGERLLVRPGVTGLAQIQLPPDTDLDSVRQKLEYDRCYVKRCGLWLDVRIMAGTAFKVVGLPFGALRVLFGLPTRDEVRQAIQPTVDAEHRHQPHFLAPEVA
jgi:lipopolysaccharide/colanic/teichoic acid biosynthesis glycosyltransferase